uniref:Uncharacterized protein n=1 Tax=Nymphaea colorata TaxID=210225 RepID=A0A5K0XWE8_9MAGN
MWYTHLEPRLNRRPFSEEEEERFFHAHSVHGNKWALIASFLLGRTDVEVMNHWHVNMAPRNLERCRLCGKSKEKQRREEYEDRE